MTDEIDGIKNLLHIFGALLMFAGAILLLPLIVLPFYINEIRYAIYFLIPASIAMLIGFCMHTLKAKHEHRLSAHQDAVIVMGLWVVTTFFCAMPFAFSGMLSFPQACFEAMSGLTTTGFTIIDVANTPHIFLMFRSLMQFVGGVGLIMIVVSALSETYGMRLYRAEGHMDKLLPNLAKSTRMILTIYLGYFIAGTLLYVIFGMPVFDAINHCMSALSTGGFSVKSNSFAAYNSYPIEFITVILMMLASTSFLANMLLIKGKFKEFIKIGEIRFILLLVGIFVPLVAFAALAPLYGSFGSAFRVSLFNLVSTYSGTGFSTVGYNNWPAFSIFVLILLMLMGGGAGSTAGGIKYTRVYLLLKAFVWNIKRKFQPERSMNDLFIYTPSGKISASQELYAEASGFVFLYFIIFAIGTSILTVCGYSLSDSLFEFASAIGDVGVSVGVVSPSMHPVALWTIIAGMLLGRLEIYIIIVAVVKVTKDVGSVFKR